MSADPKPHILVVLEEGGEKWFEVEHPGCSTQIHETDSISGDREATVVYESYTCRLQWVLDYWGLDFLEHPDGTTQGWQPLAPGRYGIVSYSRGDGVDNDTGVELVGAELSVSDKIVMRPVWERRQRRHYSQSPLDRPTEREIQDAIRVLEEGENQLLAPALYLEAFTIMDEAAG